MITYKEFLTYGIDLSPLGLLPPSEHFVPYFCTPENYTLIGSLGVDGIHFVFVRGHGETVFVITPMGDMPYCFPVARNFDHFLRLLLAVGDCNVMEYLHAFAVENLEKYKSENPPTEEAAETLQKLTALGLDPLPDPCTYVSDLDGGFDISDIRFSDEYYETIGEDVPTRPTFEVYFENNKKYPCEEYRIKESFSWRNNSWIIPAYHTSKKGLTVDICVPIEKEVIYDFAKRAESSSTKEESDYLTEISPTNLHFTPSLTVDGELFGYTQANFYYYSPDGYSGFFPSTPIGEVIAEHYGLDMDKYWIIKRAFFAKKSRRTSKFDSITLTLLDEPLIIPGDDFTVSSKGESFILRSPVDDTEYTLTVEEIADHEMPAPPGYIKFPAFIKTIYYSITPEPERRSFFLRDIVTGDRPVEAPSESNNDFAAAIAIIGGADGPTAVMFAKPTASSTYKTATSNPHYEPDFTPVWLTSWRTKVEESCTVILK